VLVLHHVDQMSTREIADALEIPKGTADTGSASRSRSSRPPFAATRPAPAVRMARSGLCDASWGTTRVQYHGKRSRVLSVS
jgi:hypothetical protein